MDDKRSWWTDKVCLITGGSRGIGAAIALQAAHYGAAVVVNYYQSEKLAGSLVRSIMEKGGKALAIQADISQEAAVENMFLTIEKTLGSVDMLVNNAGVSLRKLLVDTGMDEWQTLMDINLKGPFLCCRRALGPMMEKRCGRIVNVASIWGMRAASCESVYSAAKGGLIAFTRSLAAEMGPWGITINALAPGPIDTEILLTELDEEERAELAGEIPLGRLGRSEEVAEACLFLLSEKASFINGEVLVIDGGWKS
ncbi:MAG TPA: 3-oxoacyl-ACP reductase FabG [Syntrophomonadaceae bacterium]|nr:3-oxoacyl-ACP reductase FabG [Syntrophomonadaceae bacterium]